MPIRLLLAVLLLSVNYAGVFAQSPQQNFQKYQYYRERLTTEFTVVGDGQGMSMPAERYDTLTKTINWSDNTIWLGWYIGMLALEYHLLTDDDFYDFENGDSTTATQTLDEIYHAIKALIRLDEVAESSFPAPCDSTPDVHNGFFLRDDVPADFHTHFAGMNITGSDFTSTTNVYNKEMSQDQVYHLLLGLALVKRFIPGNITVNGMNLRQEAIAEALLIIDWVNHDGWIIKNPACQDKAVDRGEDATLLSHGINEIAKYMSDGAVNYDADVSGFYTSVWNTLTSPANPGYSNIDNLHMAMAIAAVGTGWGSGTLDALMELAISNRWYAYPMLYVALHDDTTATAFHAYRDTFNFWADSMLNEAPPEGPYSLYPDSVTHGYAVNNRFIRGRDKHYIGNFFSPTSRFNGLDYMLLHNLYYTVTPAGWFLSPPNSAAQPYSDLNYEVYPNPAGSSLFVKIPSAVKGTCDLEIRTVTGKLISRHLFNATEDIELNIESLPSGMYLLMLNSGKQGKSISKFVKG